MRCLFALQAQEIPAKAASGAAKQMLQPLSAQAKRFPDGGQRLWEPSQPTGASASIGTTAPVRPLPSATQSEHVGIAASAMPRF